MVLREHLAIRPIVTEPVPASPVFPSLVPPADDRDLILPRLAE
jgi:hypothetical protein